jgi:hypothetical protein
LIESHGNTLILQKKWLAFQKKRVKSDKSSPKLGEITEKMSLQL